jgi:hypothetical protein
MTISMYQASVPLFERMLGNLIVVLEKGAAHAAAKNIDPAVFVNARLAPDMFALAKQVQIATDMAKGCAARIAATIENVPGPPQRETAFLIGLPEEDGRLAPIPLDGTARIYDNLAVQPIAQDQG